MKASTSDKLDALDSIIRYAASGHAYLSERTEYGRGYKEGITQGKNIILQILDNYGIKHE